MKRIIVILLFVVLVAGASACSSTKVASNPTPEEIMANEQNADFFIWDDIVCKNASDIDWVQKLDLSEGTYLGEIKRSGIKEDWQNWDATVLEVGTEILELPKSGGIMIARKDGKNVPYLKLLEG